LTGERTKTYEGHLGTVNSVAVFDGELYSATSFKELFKWNISEGFITRKFSVVATGEMLSMTFKSRTLFTGSSDTTAIGWDAVSGDILLLYLGRNTKIRSVVSWKNFIISGGEDAEIRMWDVSVDSIDPFTVLNNSRSVITTLNLFEDYLYSGDYYGNIKMVSLTNLTLIMYFTSKFKGYLVYFYSN
jgi:WD40 repeat protein